MKAVKQKEWYSVQQCRENPKTLYVFGDNLIGVGKGGQAQIRDEKNTFGIPTKRLPTMNDDAFFNDWASETLQVVGEIHKLVELSKDYDLVVFPADGLGTGLAKMDKVSPKLFNIMNNYIKQYFGVQL